jgi:hypothetical protein
MISNRYIGIILNRLFGFVKENFYNFRAWLFANQQPRSKLRGMLDLEGSGLSAGFIPFHFLSNSRKDAASCGV